MTRPKEEVKKEAVKVNYGKKSEYENEINNISRREKRLKSLMLSICKKPTNLFYSYKCVNPKPCSVLLA